MGHSLLGLLTIGPIGVILASWDGKIDIHEYCIWIYNKPIGDFNKTQFKHACWYPRNEHIPFQKVVGKITFFLGWICYIQTLYRSPDFFYQ